MADVALRIFEALVLVETDSASVAIDGAVMEMPTEVDADIEAINPDGGTIASDLVSPDQIDADVQAVNPDGGEVYADLLSPDVIESDLEDVRNE